MRSTHALVKKNMIKSIFIFISRYNSRDWNLQNEMEFNHTVKLKETMRHIQAWNSIK